MAEPKTHDDLTVPQQEHLSATLDWANQAIVEGDAYLRSQPGFDKIGPSIRRINSELDELKPSNLSRATTNRFAHIALTQAASLTDIKPFWEYRTSNPRFDNQAALGNKLALHWWLTRRIDVRFADCIKYTLAGATSYADLIYNRSTDDLDMLATDPRDFYPIRPSGYELQDCFGTLKRKERSVNYLERFYPKLKGLIKPDRQGTLDTTQRYQRYLDQLDQIGFRSSPFWAQMDELQKTSAMSVPMVDEWTIQVRDMSRNESSQPKIMGDTKGNLSYLVAPGDLLYPRLRRIKFCRSVVLEDGPAPYWHGLFTQVKLTLDSWPWSWLGKSPMWDLLPLQVELDEMVRALGDIARQAAQPGVIANQNAMARAIMDKLNTRVAGMKLRTNPAAGPNAIQLQYPQTMQYELIAKHIEFLIGEMETLSGVKDVAAMMKLGQIPSTETIEKMMEAMTPLIRLRSRMIEATLRDFAMITLSNLLQFYTLPKRLAVLGPDGMTFEDFDTDPGNMVPAILEEANLGTDSTREQRAREMLRMFTYNVAPGSLLSASEVTNKMLYFQLWRAGLVDRQTLADKLSIPNYGEIPGNTILEKVVWESQNLGPQQPSPAGRPASGQTSPRLTIKES